MTDTSTFSQDHGVTVDWPSVPSLLRRWHDTRDHKLGRALFGFLEQELRTMIPPQSRSALGSDAVDDVLRDLLSRLIEVPLQGDIQNPRAYVARMLRNRFIDAHRSNRRRSETPLENADAGTIVDEESTSPADHLEAKERAARLRQALDGLGPADRVAIKLGTAPEWLTEAELQWLADRTQRALSSIRAAILEADGDVYALTHVMDPGDDDPEDTVERRKRMERFRRRRSRAREKLRDLLREEVP